MKVIFKSSTTPHRLVQDAKVRMYYVQQRVVPFIWRTLASNSHYHPAKDAYWSAVCDWCAQHSKQVEA